jgi:hypothetical protein
MRSCPSQPADYFRRSRLPAKGPSIPIKQTYAQACLTHSKSSYRSDNFTPKFPPNPQKRFERAQKYVDYHHCGRKLVASGSIFEKLVERGQK